MDISKRAKKINPSPTLAITAKAKKMASEGIDVISFGAGEPDFDTPQNIKDAAIKAINSGFTKYTPSSGTDELKKAICEKFKNENGLEYKPSQISVSCGAKHSLFNICLALLDPGDEVIIPAPYWVSYPEMVGIADGIPVYIETNDAQDFKITPVQLKSKITKKTKALILNSPSNPTGAVYSEAELKEIAGICVEHKIYVISDEIYERIVYDGVKPKSIASFGKEIYDLTITVNGVSKTYAMTGWRIGYLAAAPDFVAALNKIQDQSTSNPTSIAQKAALEAIAGPQDAVEKMRLEFDKRRKYIVEALNSIDGITCNLPKGAFYVFPNISGLIGRFDRLSDRGSWVSSLTEHVEVSVGQSSGQARNISNADDFADYLLDGVKVAVVSGVGFGAPHNIRLSYATSMESIERGIERIKEAVAVLK